MNTSSNRVLEHLAKRLYLSVDLLAVVILTSWCFDWLKVGLYIYCMLTMATIIMTLRELEGLRERQDATLSSSLVEEVPPTTVCWV